MKSKDIFSLIIIAFVATILSFLVSGKVFGASKHTLKSPEVQAIDNSFPDLKNDPSYKSVFNSNALNPTQLIQIGTDTNPSSFNTGQ
jgi:hypothetical protein